MSYRFFVLERENNVYKLIINNPKSLNSLSSDVLKEFESILDTLYSEETCRALIITGVEKAFVAGADIEEMSKMNYKEALEYGRLGHRVFSKIENAPFVTIAAINGFALGGGLELALSCDIRIASKRAKIGQPEVGLGIIPGFGATQRLARICGVSTAKYLIYTAKVIKAEKAFEYGIVTDIYAPEELMDECKKIAQEIVTKSYNAVMTAKKSISEGIDLPILNGLKNEEILFATCFSHNDQKEGMNAFLEKKRPIFE